MLGMKWLVSEKVMVGPFDLKKPQFHGDHLRDSATWLVKEGLGLSFQGPGHSKRTPKTYFFKKFASK